MTALVRRGHREVTPTVHQHAHRLEEGLQYRGLLNLDPEHPGPELLGVMRAELLAALGGCSEKEAIAAAAVLLDSYPQADNTRSSYANGVADRLRTVPSDLLGKVIRRATDDSPDFRPGLGRLQLAIDHVVGKRRALLLQVDQALAWWERHGQEKRRLAAIEADKQAYLARPAEERALALAGAGPQPTPRAPVRPNYVDRATLDRIRATRAAKTQP